MTTCIQFPCGCYLQLDNMSFIRVCREHKSEIDWFNDKEGG